MMDFAILRLDMVDLMSFVAGQGRFEYVLVVAKRQEQLTLTSWQTMNSYMVCSENIHVASSLQWQNQGYHITAHFSKTRTIVLIPRFADSL